MIKIPAENKIYSQPNNTNLLGSLYSTFNCDFESNKGALRLSERMVLNANTSDESELNSFPVGFKFFYNGTTSEFYTAAGTGSGGSVFSSLHIDTTFADVNTGGSPTSVIDSFTSDIEVASWADTTSELYVSADDGKCYYLNASNTWANLTAGTSGPGHASMLCYFPFTNKMYCSKNGNIIQVWASAHSVSTALTLPSGLEITFIRATNTTLWIGTLDPFNGRAYVFSWNGSDSQFGKAYKLDSAGALSGVIKDDTLYIINTNGQLQKFNGGTFVTLTGFNRKKGKQFYNAFYGTNDRFIHPNGMTLAKGGKINILVNLVNFDAAAPAGTQEDCNPSGVYVYDEETNSLRHRYSFGTTKEAGTITDYGQYRIAKVGGLSEYTGALISAITTNGTMLAGATIYTDATTESPGIFYEDSEDTLQKAGYLITSKIYSANITDMWQKIYVMLGRRFLNATDKIIIKGRTQEDEPVEATITYTSTTTFTVPTASFTTAPADGDEVEIVQAVGSGRTCHISGTPTSGGGNYTVTVDETITGATGTAKARFTTWKKLGSYNAQTDDFFKLPIVSDKLGASTWLQLKVWMLWTGKNEIANLIVSNKVNEAIE